MRRIVEGFPHRPGRHCESSAVRDLLEFYGFRFGEAMVFGLDNTFGFLYLKDSKMQLPVFLSGKQAMFPNRIGDLLGIEAKEHETRSNVKAWSSARGMIENGVPVLFRADIFYLDYFHLHREVGHFGGHLAVFVGFDDKEGLAYIAEIAHPKFVDPLRYQVISLENLSKARSSKFGPFPPRNASYEVAVPDQLNPIKDAITEALSEKSREFLNPPAENVGISGIRVLADEVADWPQMLPAEKLRKQLSFAHLCLEEFGTGGGNFRRIYSEFLSEAYQILGDGKILKASNLIADSADQWGEIAGTFKKASSATSPVLSKTLQSLRDKISFCADKERKAMEILSGL